MPAGQEAGTSADAPPSGAGHSIGCDCGCSYPVERGPGGGDSAPVAEGGDLGAPLPVYTINQIGDYIKQGFWDWFGGGYRSYNMTASGTGANSGIIYYDYDGFAGVAGARHRRERPYRRPPCARG